VLVVHAPGGCLDRSQDLLFIDRLRQLNVDAGPDAAAAKPADGSHISVGDQNPITVAPAKWVVGEILNLSSGKYSKWVP